MFNQCQGYDWQILISSPLQRCASFALEWAEKQRIEHLLDADWMEIDFGDWEGKTAQQIKAEDPDALQRFYADPQTYTPPNAESYSQFTCRIQRALDRIIQHYTGQHILLVTHAGVIRALFSLLLQISPRHSFQIQVSHACLTRFSCFDDESGRFVQFNFHKPA